MSFASVIAAEANKVFLVTGKELGQAAWYYVQVEKKKIPFYQKALKKGDLDLREYGQIIDSGWGDKPPSKIIKQMEEQYG